MGDRSMSAAEAALLALLALGVVVCGVLMQTLERQIAYEALRRAAPPSATGSATIGYGVTGESANAKPYPTTSAPAWDEPRDEPPAHKRFSGERYEIVRPCSAETVAHWERAEACRCDLGRDHEAA